MRWVVLAGKTEQVEAGRCDAICALWENGHSVLWDLWTQCIPGTMSTGCLVRATGTVRCRCYEYSALWEYRHGALWDLGHSAMWEYRHGALWEYGHGVLWALRAQCIVGTTDSVPCGNTGMCIVGSILPKNNSFLAELLMRGNLNK